MTEPDFFDGSTSRAAKPATPPVDVEHLRSKMVNRFPAVGSKLAETGVTLPGADETLQESADAIAADIERQALADKAAAGSHSDLDDLKSKATPVEQLPPEQQREIERILAGLPMSSVEPTEQPAAQPAAQPDAQPAAPLPMPEIARKVIDTPTVDLTDVNDSQDLDAPVVPDEEITDSAALSFCGQCGNDLRLPVGTNPTRRQFEEFEVSMITGKPFLQAYKLLGGKISLVLRTIEPCEFDAAVEAARLSQRQLALNEADATEIYNKTVLSLRIVSFSTGDQLSSYRFPLSLQEWKVEATDPGERAKAVYELVSSKLFQHESRLRLIRVTGGKFSSLLTRLESLSSNPNFSAADLSD